MPEPLPTRAWAIIPEHLAALRARAQNRTDAPGHTLDGGLALVRVAGPLCKGAARWGASYDDVRRAVATAVGDPKARAIVLIIDSPGGTVAGVMETAHFLRQAAAQKPLYAYVDGLCASGAYWLASTARVIAAPATAEIGSIGVLLLHADWSSWNEQFGVAYTYMHAGEYKAAGNPDAPLSERDRAYLEGQLAELYEIFLREAAQGRGLDPEALRQTQAKVLLAAQAREQGLIDQVTADLDEFLSQIKEGLNMTLEELRAQHPELVKAVEASARQGLLPQSEAQAQAGQAAAEAAQAEAKRLIGLAASLLGAEAADKLQTAADSGVTPEQAAAVAALLGGGAGSQSQADAPFAQRILAGLQAAGAAPLAAGKGAGGKGLDVMAEARKIAAEKNCGIEQALLAVAEAHPQAYQAYMRGERS